MLAALSHGIGSITSARVSLASFFYVVFDDGASSVSPRCDE